MFYFTVNTFQRCWMLTFMPFNDSVLNIANPYHGSTVYCQHSMLSFCRHATAAFSCRELLLIRLLERGEGTYTFHTDTLPLTCHCRSTCLRQLWNRSVARLAAGVGQIALCRHTWRAFCILIPLSLSSSLHPRVVRVLYSHRQYYFRQWKLNLKRKRK